MKLYILFSQINDIFFQCVIGLCQVEVKFKTLLRYLKIKNAFHLKLKFCAI